MIANTLILLRFDLLPWYVEQPRPGPVVPEATSTPTRGVNSAPSMIAGFPRTRLTANSLGQKSFGLENFEGDGFSSRPVQGPVDPRKVTCGRRQPRLRRSCTVQGHRPARQFGGCAC